MYKIYNFLGKNVQLTTLMCMMLLILLSWLLKFKLEIQCSKLWPLGHQPVLTGISNDDNLKKKMLILKVLNKE